MWGLSKVDIDDFEEKVRDYFRDNPLDKDDRFHREEYENDHVGPSVYTTTKEFIKREARKNDGLSWALMRNPAGLKCEGFASHAWIEGVYEFIEKLLGCWPRQVNGMYICFLSNPQIGVQELLNDDLKKSPFHLALKHAKHVIVVPNRFQSIYTRLWCVYEVYYAMQRCERSSQMARTYSGSSNGTVTSSPVAVKDEAATGLIADEDPEDDEDAQDLIIELSYGKPRNKLILEALVALAIAVAGTLFSYLFVAHRIGLLFGPVLWLIWGFMACLVLSFIGRRVIKSINNFCFENTPAARGHAKHCQYCTETYNASKRWPMRMHIALVYLEIFVFSIASGCCLRHLWSVVALRWHLHIPWLESEAQFDAVKHIQHLSDIRLSVFYQAYFEKGEELPCTLIGICMIGVFFQHLFLALVRPLIQQESHMLKFDGVEEADAHDKADKKKLLKEIDKAKDQVEKLIELLRATGHYDITLRNNIRRGIGEKQARDGVTMWGKMLTAIIAWEFWWLADLTGRHCEALAFALGFTSACIGVGTLWHFGDRALFAVEALFWSGLLFVVISNWALFWREEFVLGLKMSLSTLPLQAFMFGLALLLCHLFYTECLMDLLSKIHKMRGHTETNTNPLLRRRESMPQIEDPEASHHTKYNNDYTQVPTNDTWGSENGRTSARTASTMNPEL